MNKIFEDIINNFNKAVMNLRPMRKVCRDCYMLATAGNLDDRERCIDCAAKLIEEKREAHKLGIL